MSVLDKFKKTETEKLFVEVDKKLLKKAKSVADDVGISSNKRMVEAALTLLVMKYEKN